jgi:hypothetical protein
LQAVRCIRFLEESTALRILQIQRAKELPVLGLESQDLFLRDFSLVKEKLKTTMKTKSEINFWNLNVTDVTRLFPMSIITVKFAMMTIMTYAKSVHRMVFVVKTTGIG